jgi:hypothetical protein
MQHLSVGDAIVLSTLIMCTIGFFAFVIHRMSR